MLHGVRQHGCLHAIRNSRAPALDSIVVAFVSNDHTERGLKLNTSFASFSLERYYLK